MSKKKGASSRSRAAIGRQNRNVGKEVEREVADDLRTILDPPDLVQALADNRARLKGRPSKEVKAEVADLRNHLLKRSKVRRGEQGRGAHEPDVLTPTPWWIECARRSDVSGPQLKLAQAIKDLADAHDAKSNVGWLRAVAVVRKTGAKNKTVTLRLEDLVDALGDTGFAFEAPNWSWDLVVTIPYDVWLKIVQMEVERERN